MFGFGNSEIKLRLDEVRKRIEDSRELRGLDRDFLQRVNGFKSSAAALLQGINALSAKSSENKYSDIVKGKFCARASELLGGIEYPESILDAEGFQISTGKMLGEFGAMSIKEFRHLHAFKDGMKTIADGVKALENSAAEIGKVLQYPVSRNAMKIGAVLSSIEECESSINKLQTQAADIIEKISGIEELLKAKRKDVQKMMESSEYTRAEAMRNEMEKLNRNARTIEVKISEEFSQIERIFRKFSHISDYEIELVKKYTDDGFAAFLDDEDGKIKIILDRMRIAVESGKITIEEKKRHKLMDIMRSMSLFESLAAQYKEMKSRISSMSADIPPVEQDIERLQSGIESGEHSIARLRKDVDSREKNISASLQKISELRNELAVSTERVLGKKVVLEG